MNPSRLRLRYWRIVGFFARVTGSFIWWEIILPKIGLLSWTERGRSARWRGIASRFRRLAVRQGGLMIKVGQFLSSRLDVLPVEITDELSGLQDEVPPESFEDICDCAEAELGASLAEEYASFDHEPLAAASLGQVHRACLKEPEAAEHGYAKVVVKVQRPHIEQIVEVDLKALRRVGGWVRRYKPIRDRADVPALVEEFAAVSLAEIDYLAEGSNAETFATNLRDDPRVHVPRVVWERTTRRVLTLEDVMAIKITDYDAITSAGIDRSKVAGALLDTYMQQILEDGFFHADPHPGNLFVTPAGWPLAEGDEEHAYGPAEGPEWRLTFVDFGMVGRVPENLRTGLREALIALGTQDAARLVASYKTLGVLLPGADLNLIERASTQLFDRFWGMSMADLRNMDHAELARFAMQFRELIVDLPFQLPENLLLLGRTVAILSGMSTGLDPEFNIWTSIAPYANELIAEEGGSPWETFLAEGGKILQTLVGLPSRADRVLTMAERGELNAGTPLLNLRVRRVERAVGRVSGAIVFTGLLVAGALVLPNVAPLGWVLMASSAVPLAFVAFAGRGPHGR